MEGFTDYTFWSEGARQARTLVLRQFKSLVINLQRLKGSNYAGLGIEVFALRTSQIRALGRAGPTCTLPVLVLSQAASVVLQEMAAALTPHCFPVPTRVTLHDVDPVKRTA